MPTTASDPGRGQRGLCSRQMSGSANGSRICGSGGRVAGESEPPNLGRESKGAGLPLLDPEPASPLGTSRTSLPEPCGIAAILAPSPGRRRVVSATADWLAERVGFEPTVGCPTHAFQACALSRSATSPRNRRPPFPSIWRSQRGRMLAEREGFEPSMGLPHTPLAGERLQPLGHLSARIGEHNRSEPMEKGLRKRCVRALRPPLGLAEGEDSNARSVAEREGFEPSRACALAVFKTAAFDHSATSRPVGRPLAAIACARG